MPARPPDQVEVDGDGRPVRIRYAADVPSLQDRTRILTTTYDYRGWGEPVDVTPRRPGRVTRAPAAGRAPDPSARRG